MKTPENPEQHSENGQATLRSLGASAWEHAYSGLDRTEYYEDSVQNYARMFESCQATLAAGPDLSEQRYIELLEERVREAQGEYADMADFYAHKLKMERLEVHNLLEALYRGS